MLFDDRLNGQHHVIVQRVEAIVDFLNTGNSYNLRQINTRSDPKVIAFLHG